MKNQVTFLKQGRIAVVVILVNLFLVTPIFSQTIRPEKTGKAIYFDKSKELRDVPVVSPETRDRSWKDGVVKNKIGFHEDFKKTSWWNGVDPVLQDYIPGDRSNPIVGENHDGVSNLSGVAPPDTDGDVGPNHYFQMVNLAFAIWDKSGNLLYGPADNITLWDGFSGPWSGTNDGDPIVLYDEYADRWIASQFSLPNYPSGPYYELVAVSETGDPTGAWYRYAFEFSNMPDYPKFGIWSDGYYFTINQFSNGSSWAGAGVCVLDRDAMLAGDPNAEMIFFNMGTSYGSLLPGDCDGATLPPSGTSNFFAELNTNSLRIFEADIDWNNTSNSSVTVSQNITTEPFSYSNIVIDQPGTSTQLMAISDRLMYRLQYRNFDSYQVMLTNHTVNADGNGQAGVRWYELRNYGSGWSIHQQGTYAPDDGENRWMASIAMNGDGDIALGYSVSSATTYPSIRFAGQNAESSGTGILDIDETSIFEGNASQTGINRWGDYSMMSVDPTDDQTFWFTTEYSSGGWNWKTRIASFSYAPIEDPPVADFSADDTHPMQAQTVDFTDESSNVPHSWSWSFSPSGVTYMDGTNSGSKNPKVQFNSSGFYTVTLTATNDIGTDTEVKTNFIEVLDCSSVNTYPYLQTFDEWATSSPEMNCTADGSVSMDDCWTNGSGDDIDWDVYTSNTPSGETGPDYDHTGNGNYLYTESSSCFNSIGYIISPAFNLTSLTNPELSFWYHMYGAEMGTLSVQVSTNGGTTWSSDIWNLSGNQVDEWQEAVISLGSYGSETNLTIRITGTTGSNWHSDMAIDDFSVNGGSGSGPTANFIADNTNILINESVQFTDLSTNNPDTWSWSFPGGTPSTSNDQHPTVFYNTAGVYDVILSVSNAQGSDIETKIAYITVGVPAPVADFTSDITSVMINESVQFTDLSTNNPDTWSWSFPGGTPSSSNDQHPTVSYNTAGVYDVILSVSNSQGSDIETKIAYITVGVPAPVADFTSDITSVMINESVQFMDLSTNNPDTWSWSFPVGTPSSSNDKHPTVSYNTAGVYDVILSVSNAQGSDIETKIAYITVGVPAPVADFTSDITSVMINESVQFMDLSTNNPDTWSWSFPGGTPSSSTDQNPVISYDAPGIYEVSLLIQNAGGADSKTVINYITVLEEPAAYCDSYSLDYSKEYISVVAIGDIFNISGGSFYSDFTNVELNAEPGISYNISLTPWKSNPSRKESWRVWIDYNADGDYFDPGELIFSTNRKRNAVSGTFTIPAGTSGNTKMRIAMAYNVTALDPCDIIQYGEVEDYSVNISTPIPQPPVTDFMANSTSITEGQSVQFTDLSSNDPTSWLWTFEGGTPETSTDQNPIVVYNSAGNYPVVLTATNSLGSDTHTKLDYITVSVAGEVSYCASQSNSNELDWISSVEIGSFNNPVGPSFYSDFTGSMPINLAPGSTYDVILTPHFTGNPQREFWRIWIDFNGDGDFEDADETVFVANNKKSAVTGSLDIPSYPIGQTRMRVSMKNGSSPSPCELFAYGEVEDYTIDFGQGNLMPVTTLFSDNLAVMPNPNKGHFTLKFANEIDYNTHLYVYDLSGILQYKKKLTQSDLEFDLSYLRKGLYQIVVKSNDAYYHTKLVIN